jgi:hypothetical protein
MTLKRDDLKSVRQRRYVAKDFDGLRALLLEYVRLYYPDRIKDFSETSVGGMFLELAAYVGDNLSFYLDHQYGELNPTTAVETTNIERALKIAGVPIVGAAPALVSVMCYVQVPAEKVSNVQGPMTSAIPTALAGSIFSADNGTVFILLEDIDFNKKRSDGKYVADVRVSQKTTTGVPTSYVMALAGLCISGAETTESVTLSGPFEAFKKITLSYANVSEIVSVYDDLGNTYYQVNSLSHDVVYKNVLNTSKDTDLVKDVIKIIPAPYRFITSVDLASRRTTLTMGGGSADTLEDDVIPDPADFAISFPYSKTFSRISIDPNKLLQTKTLGVCATDTTLSITYRYGGGLSHSVPPNTIRTVKSLKMQFPNSPQPATASQVRTSLEVSNPREAAGSDDAPTADELKMLIPQYRSAQERIVSREDLLARVYTLPSNFGRVFRAAVRSNPNNPLALQLFIISRNADSQLIVSPDTLKQNLRTYLNPYRSISDAIDVIDARVINVKLDFDVLLDPSLNKSIVMQTILKKLQKTMDIKNFQIDQPIVIEDVRDVIFSTPGVVSVNGIKFDSVNGIVGTRTYSTEVFDVAANTNKGIIFPTGGAIFECRYPEYDITGKVTG